MKNQVRIIDADKLLRIIKSDRDNHNSTEILYGFNKALKIIEDFAEHYNLSDEYAKIKINCQFQDCDSCTTTNPNSCANRK